MAGDRWFDRDHTEYVTRETTDQFCDACERDIPAFVEVCAWDCDSEPGSYRPYCEECYRKLRADPWHNPPRGYADAYVSLAVDL